MSLLERKRGTGGKFRKNGRKIQVLSEDDLRFLEKNTKYDEQDIREWFSGFIDDNPDGLLSRDKMLKMYIDVLSNDKAKKFVEQIFSKYDTDNSGAIDFKEFMMATQMTDSDASDKLRLAFRMYDEDGSGTVDREEMVEMVSSMYTAQGVAKETAVERAHAVFEKLDINDDGSLDEKEFVDGCLNDERIAKLLNTASTTQQNLDSDPEN